MFFIIGVLRNFANFTGKLVCWSLFLINTRQVFSSEICEISKSNFFYSTPLLAAPDKGNQVHLQNSMKFYCNVVSIKIYVKKGLDNLKQ